MSIKLEIEIDGLDPARIQRETGAMKTRLDNLLKARSVSLREKIQAIWPVKTGKSRAGWRIAKSGALTFTLKNEVDYAIFVHRKGEVGHTIYNNEVKPMVREWRTSMRRAIAEEIRKSVAKAVKGGRIRF